MGGIVSAPTIVGILQGCSTKPNLDWKPTFFNEDQAYVISEIAEIYIPKTDTPGAKEVGAPRGNSRFAKAHHCDEVS
jgi:hypothetical protein